MPIPPRPAVLWAGRTPGSCDYMAVEAEGAVGGNVPPSPASQPCPGLGPVSLASAETLRLPFSVRFDFTAPRAWGSWQGKLFSNNGFKKQSRRQSYVSSGSGRQAERQEGESAGLGMGMWAPVPTQPLATWPCGLGQAPEPLWAICIMKPLDNTVSMQDVASRVLLEPKRQLVSGSFPQSP